MDDIWLRALLLQSIQCEEFAEIKLEITKNLDIKPTDIIRSFKVHKLALNSEEQFKDGNINLSPPRQVRRSNVNDCNEKFGAGRLSFAFPVGQKVYTRFVQNLFGNNSAFGKCS